MLRRVAESDNAGLFRGASAAAAQSPEALVDFWSARYAEMIEHIDALLAPHLHPDFFFLNIGANDGVTGDPIYPFIERYGWRGIAVEPAPPVFERLRANYAHLPDVILEPAAITSTPTSFFYVEPFEGAPEHIVSGVGSLDREVVVKSINILRMADALLPPEPVVLPGEPPPVGSAPGSTGAMSAEVLEHIVEVPVPCLTVGELLDKYGISHVDVVNIDAEGHDYEVLQMFDLEQHPPALICIEMADMSDEAAGSTAELLARHGYEERGSFGMLSSLYVR
jgi:hypothetical protein